MTVKAPESRSNEYDDRAFTPTTSSLSLSNILRDMMRAIARMLAVDLAIVRGGSQHEFAGLYLLYESTPSGLPSAFLATTVGETLTPIALSESVNLPPFSRQIGITASLLIPCIANGELLAIFAFHHRSRPHVWTKEEIHLAQAMVDGVTLTLSIALEQIHLYRRVQQHIQLLQYNRRKVKKINQYLIQSVLKRFLPASIVHQVAQGQPILDLPPEPREITVLFSDMVGFTPLSIQLGPKRIAILLNDYFSTMTQAVVESGGNVDKFMGDAIFVLFGAPDTLSLEEQAYRAIATARAMYRSLDELNEKWRRNGLIGGDIPPVQFRCGIHQGNAIVGMFGGEGRADYTAIGPAINIASRLQVAADANRILVSRSIAKYLRREEITGIESLKLKGIETETVAYSVSINPP
jgi:class 3 adenylate cyclase